MEKAMPYDEPYEYFTYQWASHINRYMKYLENEYEYPEGYWQNKSGMSIGVTSDYFYTYNSDVRGFETSLNEYLQDVKICHACKIGEISGFSLRSFIDNWGIEGLERLLEDLNSYETVSFEYKRRATYFGNLRWGVNINGSVFGLFYSDGFYSNWFNMLSLISLIGLGIIVLASMIKKYPDTSFYGKMGKSRKREKNGKKREKMTPEGEKREEIKENKKSKSTYLRIFFFIMWGLVLFWAFGMGKIFFYPPQAVGWLDFYWEEVALDDEQFFAFWTYFTENIAHYLIAAIIIIPILAYTLVRYFDKKK